MTNTGSSSVGSSSGGTSTNFPDKLTSMIEDTDLEELREYFKKNNRVKEYGGHSHKIHTLDWNADGRRLASGSFDKTVCIFQMDRDKLSKEVTFKGHTDSVDQLCWHAKHPDLLATASGDKTVRIWDARIQKTTEVFTTKGENINITWSPDGNFIAVGNKEDLITFIDIRAGKIRQEVPFKFEVNEITFNPNSNLFLTTNGQGCVLVYTFPEMKLVHQVQAHPANCICIEFHPSGKYFAVGSACRCGMPQNWLVSTFTNLDWPVRAISFNHDGSLLASASEDLTIDISHVETGEKVCDFPVENPTFTISFHPTRNILAFACDDKDKYDRERDSGTLKLFGLPSD
ncbi:THO complex subunit 3 [Orchesella cincta]|uniref:THO complex subunit 3 n=1 Tax=Orchesella cincta TaxID=48709 RepID=A0A1D2MJR2_ORCCI|nr:THO complex subunit 3 [Orchesella cincta]